MTGHVTYACNCLNVKIHLANKYYLEGHDKFRKDKFTRLTEPPISGWKFELSMEGVTVEYESLVRLRVIMDNPEGWMTVSCHNCSTGDVYSVKRPDAKIGYPFNKSILSKFGDQVIIHKGTIFGSEIEQLQKKATYSSTFHIILNPDLPINHISIEDESNDAFVPELKNQRKQVQQLLKQSLINLEEATEQKIQAYQREQELLLVREKEKATYDSAILWQTMKEIAKTVHEEEQRVRRLSLSKTKNGVTDQILFNRIISDEEQEHTLRDTSLDSAEAEMAKNKSHVHFTHEYSFGPEQNMVQRRRSSAFRRDLFGGVVPSSYNSNRRTSYVLDESAIANSFKKAHHLEPVPELPPFQRRRSSLTSPLQHQDHASVHPLAEPTNNIHPLSRPEENNAGLAVIPSSSNTSSSWEDEEEGEKGDDVSKQGHDIEEEEELFPLDEDMEIVEEYSLVPPEGEGSHSQRSKRRPSSKYIEFEEEHEDDTCNHLDVQANQNNFATSVPITIEHSPAFTVKNKMEPMHKHPSSSFIEPNHLKSEEEKARKPSFMGFDYAEADRRASLKFPPLENRRKSSIAITLSHASLSHHTTPNKNDDNHINNTHRRGSIKSIIDEEDEDLNGPMIPPHILAANTITDETDAIFGSVPRSSIRHRPLE